MGWLPLCRFTIGFLLLFGVIPACVRGRRPNLSCGCTLACAFAGASLFLHLGLTLLGLTRLALPGAATLLYTLCIAWMAALRIQDYRASHPSLEFGFLTTWLVRCAEALEHKTLSPMDSSR